MTPTDRAPTARVFGRPAAAVRRDADRRWRAGVARAGARLAPARGLVLDFTVAPGRFVDLDSLVEVVVAGLRDGGALGARLADLDVVVATRRDGPVGGVGIAVADAVALAAAPPPGPVAVAVVAPDVPRPGRRDAKRALRDRLAADWGGRAPLPGPVWADLSLAGPGSLLTPMEPAIDTLEPVLGRDPRGQPRQEFFPNDHVITWLRVRRTVRGDPPVALSVGPRA